ncbi:hypothetical protein CXG81DRAFT_21355, partial [Caulochytrium protostelioides]
MFGRIGERLVGILDEYRVPLTSFGDPSDDPSLAEAVNDPCGAEETAAVPGSTTGTASRRRRRRMDSFQCPFPSVKLRSLVVEPEAITSRDFPAESTTRFYGECVAAWEQAKQMGLSREEFLSSRRTPDGLPLTLSTFRGYQKMWKVRVASERKRVRFQQVRDLLEQRFGSELAGRTLSTYIQRIERAMTSFSSVSQLERFLEGPSSLPKKRLMLAALRAALAVGVEVIPGLTHDLVAEKYALCSSETKILQGNGRRTQRERQGWVSEAELLAASETLLSRVPAEGDAAADEIDHRLQR